MCWLFPYKLKLTDSSREVYHDNEEATAATIIIANLIVIGEYVLSLLWLDMYRLRDLGV